MTNEKKHRAIQLVKQALETVEEREYKEVAEIPTEDEHRFEVKYSFLHDGAEGIFNLIVLSQPDEKTSGEEEIRITLLSEFPEDSLHHESATAKEQVDNDLLNVEEYIKRHINQG